MKTKNKIIFVLVCVSALLFSSCAGILNEKKGYTSATGSSKYTMDIVAIQCRTHIYNKSTPYFYSTRFCVLNASESDIFRLISGEITSNGTIDASASTTVDSGSYYSWRLPLTFSKTRQTSTFVWDSDIKEPSSTTGYVGVFDEEYTTGVYGYDDISTLYIEASKTNNSASDNSYIFNSYYCTGTEPDGFYYSATSVGDIFDSSYASNFTEISEGGTVPTGKDGLIQ